jgi:hypothetical protein
MATTFASFVSGSLGLSLVDGMATTLGGLTPTTTQSGTQSLYSSVDDVNAVYVRNTNLFTSVDLTCIPVWNSWYANMEGVGNRYNGVLVTPQHLLVANHAHSHGGTVRFVDNSNNTVTATIASDSGPISGTDLCVLTLTSPVSSAITPASVLPSTFRSQLPQAGYGYPTIFTNQNRLLLVGDLISDTGSLTVLQSTDGTRGAWWIAPIYGDSGSACGMIIDGQFVALTQWFTAGGGPIDADNITAINAVMTGYSLTEFDLSAYTSF